ncbi:MAG TPA: cupin domain-containing protein [Chthoniobacterales bacterium]
MKIIQLLGRIGLALSVTLFVFGARASSAEDALKSGKILQRTDLVGAKGFEAILVLRELPPGGESGKHTQNGNEFVYVLQGSVIFEAQGKAPITLKAGESFQTTAGEVHNVKNASASEPGKALAFNIARTGTLLEDLSVPAK